MLLCRLVGLRSHPSAPLRRGLFAHIDYFDSDAFGTKFRAWYEEVVGKLDVRDVGFIQLHRESSKDLGDHNKQLHVCQAYHMMVSCGAIKIVSVTGMAKRT